MKRTRSAIVLLTVLTLILSFSLSACSGDNEVAKNNLNTLIKAQDEAINNRDLDALLSCYAPSARESIQETAEQIVELYGSIGATISTEINEYNISGNNATLKVTLTVTAAGAENVDTVTVSCVNEGNAWYLLL